jgi:hypothetical protein
VKPRRGTRIERIPLLNRQNHILNERQGFVYIL